MRQGERRFYLLRLPAEVLVSLSYAAIRGDSQEPEAVQRFLNSRRISSIKNFALKVGIFPNNMVLNWVNKDQKLTHSSGELSIPLVERSAQIIDGQHRIAGIREAIEDNKELRTLEIPVAMYDGLMVKDCADIFLSINTEQKPVPRSLVFDLYGLSSEYLVDPAAVRAKDIAEILNSDDESPYNGLIKFPGAPRQRGGIALSTVVTGLKPLVEDKGSLYQVGIKDLERQAQVVLNFFQALSAKYGRDWIHRENAFIYASGFLGALEFFRTKMVSYCQSKSSFTVKTISDAIRIDKSNLIYQQEVRGLGGKNAPLRIQERLFEAFDPTIKTAQEIEI